MFTLIAPQLGAVKVNDHRSEAERLRARAAERQHRLQRDRVRASLLLHPDPTSGKPGE